MNYEQKYNEVLQKAKEEYNRLGELGNESMKRRFEIIFPELRESEDEKIRKWLIRTLKALNTSGVSIDGAYEMLLPSIDWLEKQKEQKPGEDSEYRKAYLDGWNARNLQAAREQKPVEWSEEDEKIIENIIDHLREYYVEKVGYPYVMEKDSVEMKEISLLRSIQAKHAQEWGEEEMKYINTCLLILNRPFHDMSDGERAAYNWLKSLRPSWKPSEEQMDRLFSIVAALRKDYCDDMADFLASLYKQLKAL